MNTPILITLLGFALAALLSGCAGSGPTLPEIHYPVTYQVPVGAETPSSDYGPQHLTVNATQDVTVRPGTPIYFTISSPVAVRAFVYEKSGPSENGSLLTQLSGTDLASSLTPQTSLLEFSFQPLRRDAKGTLQFTLSDQPIPERAPAPG